ncbi:hypothetical protein [Chelativorans sp. Marseille-P2723]|uniref:hypothetical protein n=1 Tax=Chelativorans sp. Marseille-P2723 TaxID=2709133 RepID=UPI001570618E|nr:hypothetical protein [Chelativorans sp. Marseille-P2723]
MRSSIRLFGVALILWPLLSSNAFALSCMPPTPENVFNLHRERITEYVMAVGKVTPAGSLRKFNWRTLKHEPLGRFRATFDGYAARRSGFDLPLTLPVTVERSCFNGVCGMLPVAFPAVVFLRKEESRYLLQTEYCNSTLLPNPTGEDLASLIRCLNGGGCSAPN